MLRPFVFLWFVLPCFGFYVGNPADPAILGNGFFSGNYLVKGGSGYLYDYTMAKRYYTSPKSKGSAGALFKQFGLHSQMGSLSLILLERVELFGYLGGSKEQLQGGAVAPSTPENRYQFSWATGIKAVLMQWGMVYLSGNFTYFAIPSSSQPLFQFWNPLGLSFEMDGEQKTALREWQISPALSSRFGFVTPYVGATYLHSILHVAASPFMKETDYENKMKWGFFFGFTVSLTGKFHLNLERRVQDESGYSLATTAVF